MYIFILNSTFSRVLNSIKSMDSTDSLCIIEITGVLYPSYVYLQVSLMGLVHWGVQDTVKYGVRTYVRMYSYSSFQLSDFSCFNAEL